MAWIATHSLAAVLLQASLAYPVYA